MSENNSNSNHSNGSNGNGHKPKGDKPKKPRKKRRYSDKQIGEALAVVDACGGDLRKAEKATGIPDSTLDSWLDGIRQADESIPEIRAEKGRELADMFEDLARVSVETAMGLQSHEKTTLGMAATAAAIATDKMQLLRSKPTVIQGTENDEFNEMLREYAKRFNLPLSVARENIKRNLTNPTAIAALDACVLASEKEQ